MQDDKVLLKTKGGRYFYTTMHDYKNLYLKRDSQGYKLATDQEIAIYNAKYNIDRSKLLDVYFPYWDNPMINDGYGGVAIEMMNIAPLAGMVLNTRFNNQKIALIYHIPGTIERFCKEHPNFKGVKVVYTMYETTAFPQRWVDIMAKYADVVIVPSEWNKEVLDRQFSEYKRHIPVEVVYHGINLDYWSVADRPEKFDGKFRFLTYNAGNHRKGFPDYLEAFVNEFSEDEPVEYICKTWAEWRERFFRYSKYKNIKIVTGVLDRGGQNKLLHQANCFVFPSRGEGFGLPPLEAVATGMPVILTKAHSHLVFWNKACYSVGTRLVPSEIEPIIPKVTPPIHNHPNSKQIKQFIDKAESLSWKNSGEWYKPNIKDIQKRMREVYNNWSEAKAKGLEGAEYVREKFTYVNAVKNLKVVLDKYL